MNFEDYDKIFKRKIEAIVERVFFEFKDCIETEDYTYLKKEERMLLMGLFVDIVIRDLINTKGSLTCDLMGRKPS